MVHSNVHLSFRVETSKQYILLENCSVFRFRSILLFQCSLTFGFFQIISPDQFIMMMCCVISVNVCYFAFKKLESLERVLRDLPTKVN